MPIGQRRQQPHRRVEAAFRQQQPRQTVLGRGAGRLGCGGRSVEVQLAEGVTQQRPRGPLLGIGLGERLVAELLPELLQPLLPIAGLFDHRGWALLRVAGSAPPEVEAGRFVRRPGRHDFGQQGRQRRGGLHRVGLSGHDRPTRRAQGDRQQGQPAARPRLPQPTRILSPLCDLHGTSSTTAGSMALHP